MKKTINIEKKIFGLRNYLLIQNACKVAQSYSRFLIIAGETGTGKTEGLLSYAETDKQNVVYVRLRKSMTTSDFFAEIAKHYDYRFSYKTHHRFLNFLRDRLKVSQEKHLLIIDEGGMFNYQQLGFIHEIRDLTSENMGIVLAGPIYFSERLDEWSILEKQGVPEFYRRVNTTLELNNLTKPEILAICDAYKISHESKVVQELLKITKIGDLITSIENNLYFNNLLKIS